MWSRAPFDVQEQAWKAMERLVYRYRRLDRTVRASLFAALGTRLFSRVIDEVQPEARPRLIAAFAEALAAHAGVSATVSVRVPEADTAMWIKGTKVTLEGDG